MTARLMQLVQVVKAWQAEKCLAPERLRSINIQLMFIYKTNRPTSQEHHPTFPPQLSCNLTMTVTGLDELQEQALMGVAFAASVPVIYYKGGRALAWLVTNHRWCVAASASPCN